MVALRLTLIALVAALLVAGCGVAPERTPLPFESGGLGITREQWEGWAGGGTQEATGYAYEGGYHVSYQADVSGVSSVSLIDRDYDSLDIAGSRRASEYLLPSDRVFVRTTTPTQGRAVDYYTSEWLKGRLPANLFVGGAPGSFTVVFRLTEGRITSIVVAPGNNP